MHNIFRCILVVLMTVVCCMQASAQTYKSANVYFYCKSGQSYGVGKQCWFLIIDDGNVYDSTVTTSCIMSRDEAINKVNTAIRNCRYGRNVYSYNSSLSTSKYDVYSRKEQGSIGITAGTYHIAIASDKSHMLRWRQGRENDRGTYTFFDSEEIIPKPIDNSFLE